MDCEELAAAVEVHEPALDKATRWALPIPTARPDAARCRTEAFPQRALLGPTELESGPAAVTWVRMCRRSLREGMTRPLTSRRSQSTGAPEQLNRRRHLVGTSCAVSLRRSFFKSLPVGPALLREKDADLAWPELIPALDCFHSAPETYAELHEDQSL